MKLFVLGLLLCGASALPRLGLKRIETGERVFVEVDSGREIILHGLNAIVKGFPYVPATDEFDPDISLVAKDHQTLADLGVNVYRLGAMWPGVEPTRNVYNSTYIAELKKIVNEAAKEGIYTVLDMHQDVFSEKFCGEGVPAWAAIPIVDSEEKSFPFPLEAPFTAVAADGFPTRQDCAHHNWPQYYNTFAAGSAFESLYQNVSGLMDSWQNFWSYLAEAVGNNNDNVIGYELMNEPMGGDALSKPALFIPGVADRTVLQPAYDKLQAAIRKVDQESLIIFAAVTWDDVVPVGFTAPPGGEAEANRSVFAFHYYEPPQIKKEVYFHQRNADSRRLGTGSMMTEFERPEIESEPQDDKFVEQAEMADKYGLSWMAWEYKTFCKETPETLAGDSQQALFGSCKTGYGSQMIFDANGNRNDVPSRKLARTYVRATAGRLESMAFDAVSGQFRASWRPDLAIKLPTEIFAQQELNYPTGMDITVLPPRALAWKVQGNVVSFFTTPLTPADRNVVVTINRKVV